MKTIENRVEDASSEYAEVMMKMANAYGFKAFVCDGMHMYFDKEDGERWTIGIESVDHRKVMPIGLPCISKQPTLFHRIVEDFVYAWFLTPWPRVENVVAYRQVLSNDTAKQKHYAVSLPPSCNSLDELKVTIDLMSTVKS